jgi:glycosyltransferase involved in cell wall biosynthesis
VPSPLVSVVIPLFNKSDYVEATLRSVAGQDYPSLEIVLIDDGSSDDGYARALDLLTTNIARFANVITLTRENRGQAYTRNQGVYLSSGEYVAFLDADDIWHPRKISKQVSFLERETSLDLVFCNYIMLSETFGSAKAVSLKKIDKKIRLWLMTLGYGGLVESTGLLRTSSISTSSIFNEKLQMSGGLDFSFRYSHERRVGCINEYLCGYRLVKDGWHNNKVDLLNSMNELFAIGGIYSRFIGRLRVYLQIHMNFWSLRRDISLANLYVFAKTLGSFPLLTTYYLIYSLYRVGIAQVRSFFYIKQVRFLRKVAQL